MSAGQRKDNETFKDYRKRLKHEALYEKLYLKGTMIWNSSKYGTYERMKHGPLDKIRDKA